MEGKLLTVAQAAQLLEVEPSVLRLWILHRRIPHVRLVLRLVPALRARSSAPRKKSKGKRHDLNPRKDLPRTSRLHSIFLRPQDVVKLADEIAWRETEGLL